MPKKGIPSGRLVSPELYARAMELHQDMKPEKWMLWQYLRVGRLQGCHFRRQPIMHFSGESYKVIREAV